MKVSVLSSGSKGNTTYIETKKTKILIDAGNTSKYIIDTLKEIDVNPSDIDAILITHIHSDHTKGLPVLLKHINPCIYLTKTSHKDLGYIKNYQYIENDKFSIKDIDIEIIKTSHDAPDSLGYIISNNNKSVVYITDTGYINRKYYSSLNNKDIYIMESNHDIEMLNNGSYPFELRQRILSDKGHLSNYDSSNYLCDFIGDNTKKIILAHLSEENNTESLAYDTLKKQLAKKDIIFEDIIIAKQNKRTELINV